MQLVSVLLKPQKKPLKTIGVGIVLSPFMQLVCPPRRSAPTDYEGYVVQLSSGPLKTMEVAVVLEPSKNERRSPSFQSP